MADKRLVTLSREEKIGIIQINRPQALNALNQEVCVGIIAVMQKIEYDRQIHVVILKGDDHNFAAGADIGNMAEADGISVQEYVGIFNACIDRIYQCPVPIIAYLRGFVLGGGLELALAADIRIAGQEVKMGFPEINLGIIPGAGGTQRLPRLTGVAKAKEFILLGNFVNAEEALALHMVNQVYAQDRVWPETLRLAQKISEKPLEAVKKAKLSINAAENMSIDQGRLYEVSNLLQLFYTQDKTEGMKSFLEKRKADFQNK